MSSPVEIEFVEHDGDVPSCSGSAVSGEPLVDFCDRLQAPVDFSCRAACCSTCRVQVLAGGDLLEPPDEMEEELIAAAGGATDERYCCAAVLRANTSGKLRLRPLGACF